MTHRTPGQTAPLIGVVDDDDSMREALESLLRSAGFRTAAFASAVEFLGARGRLSLDLLILDVLMPGVSGLELQEELMREGSRTPIVFISAHGDAGERKRGLARGAVDFLYKPFSEDSLLEAIAAALGSKGT